MPSHLSTIEAHAIKELAPAAKGQLSPQERIALYKRFLKIEEHRIKLRHGAGAGGLEVAQARATLLDLVLASLHRATAANRKLARAPFALVADGGYGRGALNPGSDVDLLFLLPRASNKLPKELEEFVQEILYLLWDVGFKVGHSSRSIPECIATAREDHQTRTALMDARFIAGNSPLFAQFYQRFEADCILKGQDAYCEQRRIDIDSRYNKYSHTVFLQEPNVKEGCGGLRDVHNMRWISRVKTGSAKLETLVENRQLGRAALREIRLAEDFLHRVRNDLHYHTGTGTDILTLQLQGVVATNFNYPQRSILRRTEAFMRDYYRHTRNLQYYTASLMDSLDVRHAETESTGLRSFLTQGRRKREVFDGFVARDGLLHPSAPGILREDSPRLMRLFLHCQMRGLSPSNALRRMITESPDLIDRPFRYAKKNRETFRAILERKGEVGRTLRQMHRLGVLGRYLPEFGALDCLVQHEFFHLYTADEHTLRCIEALDALVDSDNPQLDIYRRLLLQFEDPYALYLAVILHDTGRAENVREHIDGSAVLASKVCNRLQIRGGRRAMVTFLVDNHLSFWRFATTRNVDDPDVVAEFARIVRTPQRLDALLLFTYCDSTGTNPEAWSSWKETLMLQLHSSTRQFLEQGSKAFAAALDAERKQLRKEVDKILKDDWSKRVREHFKSMPPRYFRFRDAANVATHIRAVHQFIEREKTSERPFACAIQWIDHREQGSTELVIVTRDRPHLLERLCCALASEQINILSADFFTRSDGIVVDIFRVCTTNFEPVASRPVQLRVVDTLYQLNECEDYDAGDYLLRRQNLLRSSSFGDITCPVRAELSNRAHPACTVIEIQALDRIGLLHDIFHAINALGLNTSHARICTEKGAAIDTLYVTTAEGEKVTDPVLCEQLRSDLEKIAAISDDA